ncbi:allophanate hydrolase [Nonomuraea insulae]|uniref:Allophanate hydrolase n=1 Tax=Nonomuraea insulae TaxID=1616787 RepID=A0ABW1CFX2_9ACTN
MTRQAPGGTRGRRAVLVHGAATTARIWDRTLPYLSAFDTLTPDRPSTGDLDSEVAAIAELCANATVIGVSGGATLGLALAAHSIPFRAAVLHEPAAGSLAPGLLAHVAEGMRTGGVPGFGRALYGPAWHPSDAPADPEAVARDFAMFSAFEPEAVGPGAGPILLTVGERSPEARHRSVRALSDRLGVPYAVVPAAGHAVHLENPKEFAALITGHVAQPAADRVRRAYARIEESDRPEVWITLRDREEVLAEAARVDERVAAGDDLPFAGKVIAVKDNIDVAGLPTTAACPAYAYTPEVSAPAVARLVAAGAIVLGKTNLDQFATGLVGTRSPHGAVRSAHDPELISGGSSSGSAVAVALGIADLALGTDTAGSGRVPAAFQGIAGVKPTLGLVPKQGVVPAARSFDCVSVFAPTVSLAQAAVHVMADPPGRPWPPNAPLAAPPAPRIAVPDRPLPQLSPSWAQAFQAATDHLAKAGADLVPIDVTPFLEAATLMYGGAFAAERYAAVGPFVESHPGQTDPSVHAIIAAARAIPAHHLARDLHRLATLRAQAMRLLAGLDALLLPTVPRHPRITEVEADPIGVNSELGVYTNFVNLFDLCAVAVPAGQADGGPFGVTLIGRPFADHLVADLARLLNPGPPVPPAAPSLPLAVFGAHLSGHPLNHHLTTAGARLVRTVRTAPEYRMYALADRPGLVRIGPGGTSIEGELWSVPPAALGPFLHGLPAPMALGKVALDDGSLMTGFVCEPHAVADAADISHFGSWPAYLER